MAAAAVYVLSWLTGLATGPSSPSPTADAAAVHAFYAAHSGGVLVQSLLVHGLAGVMLAVLACCIPRHGPGRLYRAAAASGVLAAALSLTQVALAGAATKAATAPDREKTLAFFHAVNYTDIVKLVALAAFVATTTLLLTRLGHTSRAVRGIAAVLVPLLPAGSFALIAPESLLTALLALSLLLLLTWTALTGWALRYTGTSAAA
ncbi:hypothetical protein [Streptomyces sp. NPDC051016]|uniref:hypothetical protein n=1 Tax=Streptomyces sp. NPDC051016 TaxID=3365638 RepID=UPI0037890BBF